jgi:hypothetical protein
LFVHRLDFILETLRGYCSDRAEFSVGGDEHGGPTDSGLPTNASDISGCVRAWFPDADGIALACNIGGRTTYAIKVADVDIVIARGEISAGPKAQCDVPAAACAGIERSLTSSRVEATGFVAKECRTASGGVPETDRVAVERC